MAFLERKTILLAKIEVTEGTDPTPSGSSNAILVSNLQRRIYEGSRVKRDILMPYLGNDFEYNAGPFVTVTFDVELAGSAAAGTAPQFGPLLRACAMAETISAGVSVTYTPVSASFDSVTLYYNLDGQNQVITGARGNVTLNMQRGQIPKLSFTMTGRYARPTAVALPSTTYTSVVGRPVNKANTTTASVHSQAVYMESFSLDMGVAIAYRNLPGLETVAVTDRTPSGSVVFEKLPIATKNYYSALESHNSAITTGSISVVHGPTSGSGGNCAITLSNVQLNQLAETTIDGIVHDNFSFIPTPGSTGNDEISIAFA